MTLYAGERTLKGSLVTADGAPLPDGRAIKLFSRTGFEWGFEGPGPRQLALAMLLHHLNDPAQALALSQPLMQQVIATLDNAWQMTGEELSTTLQAL